MRNSVQLCLSLFRMELVLLDVVDIFSDAVRVTRMELEGYGSHIPRYRTVSVVCPWENGNPPTRAIILKVEQYLGTRRYVLRCLTYIYTSRVYSGRVIHVEANGSDRNDVYYHVNWAYVNKLLRLKRFHPFKNCYLTYE